VLSCFAQCALKDWSLLLLLGLGLHRTAGSVSAELVVASLTSRQWRLYCTSGRGTLLLRTSCRVLSPMLHMSSSHARPTSRHGPLLNHVQPIPSASEWELIHLVNKELLTAIHDHQASRPRAFHASPHLHDPGGSCQQNHR
jgi:hypothetical protein